MADAMKRIGRIFALFAVACVSVMLIAAPRGAWAEDATLQSKIDAAENGATVTLDKDYTESVTIGKDQNLVLDLNGFTLSGGTTPSKAALTNNGTLVIKDSSGSNSGKIIREDNGTSGYYTIDNQGTMTIESGSVYNATGPMPRGASLIRNAGAGHAATLNIKGGDIKQDGFIAVKNDDLGILNVTGGTITTTGDKPGYSASAVQNWNQATISGGTVTGALWTSSWSADFDAPQTVVKDDAVLNGKIIIKHDEKNPNGADPELKIEGGKLNVDVWSVQGDGKAKVEVSGGAFSGADGDGVVNYMADSVVALKDDSGFKVMTDAEAKASGAAASVAKDGKTVYFTKGEDAEQYAKDNGIKVDEVKPVSYTVAFNDDQFKTEVKAQTVNFGLLAIEPVMPATKDGYKFEGWFNGDAKFDFMNNAITGDVVLTAKWSKIETPVITANDFTWDLAKGELEAADVFELSGAKAEPLDGDIFNFGVVTSDLDALLAAAKDGKTGTYELQFMVNENVEPYTAAASKKITVTLTDSSKPADKVEDGKKDEGEKPADKKAGDKALPQTGDASMLPMLVASGAGVAAIAAGAIASKRRK